MTDLVIPKHIGFILDGNRRWAKQHGLPAYEGHLAGYNAIMDVLLEAFEFGVRNVSVYAFSTENWKRDTDEVNKIMKLVNRIITTDLDIIIQKGVRLIILGLTDGLDSKMLDNIKTATQKTAKGKAGTLAICFNYGGQQEIVDATKKILANKISSEDLTIDTFRQYLYNPELPDLDLVVRTSGEQRLSNFMLWRIAYSEIMFIDKMWPEMQKKDMKKILRDFSKRSRRFGG